MKEKILEAVNEVYGDNIGRFCDIFDFYSVEEIIDAYLVYNGFGNCSYELFKLYRTFFIMTAKQTIADIESEVEK